MPVIALDQEVETTNVTAAEDLRDALTTLLYVQTDDTEIRRARDGARLKIIAAVGKIEKQRSRSCATCAPSSGL